MGEASSRIIDELTGAAEFVGRSGKVRHVLFDLEAVMMAEALCGRSVFDLLAGRPGVTDMVNLLLAGSKGYSRRPGVSAKEALNPTAAMKAIADCGGLIDMLPTMLRSLTKAQGIGMDVGDDDEDEEADDVGPPGHGPTS